MTTSKSIRSFTNPSLVYHLSISERTGRAIACSCPSFYQLTKHAAGTVSCKHMRRHNAGQEALEAVSAAIEMEREREAVREAAVEQEAQDNERLAAITIESPALTTEQWAANAASATKELQFRSELRRWHARSEAEENQACYYRMAVSASWLNNEENW